MAKIIRKVQKIFGSAAGPSQRGVFGSKAAGSPAFSTDPETIQSLSNYLGGWFTAVIGGNAPCIEDMNALQFLNSYQLAYLMQAGVPEWEAGTSYYIGSLVNDSGTLYRSLVDDNLGNAVSDTSKWKAFSTDPVGTLKPYLGSTAPAGHILASGRTIGSSASGATERANADTVALYTMLWNDYDNTILPIQDSAGVATTRGGSAAADFAANKRMPVPDMRGRVAAGRDDMGGTAASRLTAAVMSPNGNTLGAVGGTQTHTLTTTEMPTHAHGVNDPGHSHTVYGVADGGANQPTPRSLNTSNNANVTTSSNTTGISIQNNGGGAAHTNTQPTFVTNYIIKL